MGGFSSDATGNRYVPQLGDDPMAGDKAGTTGTSLLYSGSASSIVPFPTNSHLGWYHTFLSGEQPAYGAASNNFAKTGAWTANYQFNIDSKLYPQVSFQLTCHAFLNTLSGLFKTANSPRRL